MWDDSATTVSGATTAFSSNRMRLAPRDAKNKDARIHRGDYRPRIQRGPSAF